MGYFPTRILLATDGSEEASLALRVAVDLSVQTGSELHVVHAWQSFPAHSHPSIALASDSGFYEEEAHRLLFEQLDAVESMGGTTAGAHPKRGRPADTIAALGEQLGAGLVVVGSRRLGPFRRLVMGSVSEDVVGLAPCPVLVVRGGTEAWPPSHIVIGDDSSPEARRAGELAAGIGEAFEAQVLLVRAHPVIMRVSEAAKLSRTVVTMPDNPLRNYELDLQWRAREMKKELGRRPRIRVCEGEAASVILATAREGGEPALVAVGRRGLGRVDLLRMGSVSTRVLRAATGPVLVCPS